MDGHILKTLLQLQLASDTSAILHLPYSLSSLTKQSLLPSSHTQKWIARLSSLLHSKDAGARWAGLCLANRTCSLASDILIECGQSWISTALQLLMKTDVLPVMKASIVLCTTIFTRSSDVPEFIRQVVLPNLPKFISAVLPLLKAQSEVDLKISILDSLSALIPLYSSTFKSSAQAITASVLQLLSGSSPHPTDQKVLVAASQVYSILHLTGGKVGAANIWRKSVDDTLDFAYAAFQTLQASPTSGHTAGKNDPLVLIPLNLDRVRCSVQILCDLLSAPVLRPVPVPIGPMARFASALLNCSTDEKVDGHVDISTRMMEISILPSIRSYACRFLQTLGPCVGYHLIPHIYNVLDPLIHRLEHTASLDDKLPLLQALHAILTSCHPTQSPLLSSRLTRAVLPAVSMILPTKSAINESNISEATVSKKKSKKRSRGYEGDELFQASRGVVFKSAGEAETTLLACDVLKLLLQDSAIPTSVQSIACRVLLSIQLLLPQTLPSTISSDPTVHVRLSTKIQRICTDIAIGGHTSVTSKSIGIVLNSLQYDDIAEVDNLVDLLLHPRAPPIVRSMPPVDALVLCRAEEGIEETQTRETLGLAMLQDDVTTTSQSVPMDEDQPLVTSVMPTLAVKEARSIQQKQLFPSMSLTSQIAQKEAISAKESSEPIIRPVLLPSASAKEVAKMVMPTAENQEGSDKAENPPAFFQVSPREGAEKEDEEMPSIDMESDSEGE